MDYSVVIRVKPCRIVMGGGGYTISLCLSIERLVSLMSKIINERTTRNEYVNLNTEVANASIVWKVW